MNTIYIYTVLILCLGFSMQLLSCGGAGDTEGPEEKLSAYCVRQCVLETGDSSICDTRCECASKALSDQLSAEDFESLVTSITGQDQEVFPDALKEFGKAFSHCKSVRK